MRFRCWLSEAALKELLAQRFSGYSPFHEKRESFGAASMDGWFPIGFCFKRVLREEQAMGNTASMAIGSKKERAVEVNPPQKHVYGPVLSRRLGRSLGIDPIPPKTCNWNCVYCQLGRTTPLQSERAEYIPTEEILEEAETALYALEPGSVDWVTLVGSGEPLLHRNIGGIIRGLKGITDIPVAVITNGSLLSEPAVTEDLLAADAILPTLDAGTEELFRRINRPHPSFSFRRQVNGLIEFRRQYPGQLLLEMMLVKGLNDSEEALLQIRDLVAEIRPDEVHISLPERPPAEPWVRPGDMDSITRASAILGEVSKVLHPGEGILALDDPANALEKIFGVIGRHPLSEAQLLRALAGLIPYEKEEVLREMESSGRAKRILRYGCAFWVSASARFPDDQSETKRKRP